MVLRSCPLLVALGTTLEGGHCKDTDTRKQREEPQRSPISLRARRLSRELPPPPSLCLVASACVLASCARRAAGSPFHISDAPSEPPGTVRIGQTGISHGLGDLGAAVPGHGGRRGASFRVFAQPLSAMPEKIGRFLLSGVF